MKNFNSGARMSSRKEREKIHHRALFSLLAFKKKKKNQTQAKVTPLTQTPAGAERLAGIWLVRITHCKSVDK